ncbi:MAG TPA: hypothetical protein VGI45_26655 [Terracidiphilus sp.]|jgi:hypothetical protein
MIESLFAHASSRSRYLAAPLLKEREEYLLHLLNQGRSHKHVTLVAKMLLNSLQMLNLVDARPVNRLEVANASTRWLLDDEANKRRKRGTYSAYNFSRITMQWLRFHGMLVESRPELPFEQAVICVTPVDPHPSQEECPPNGTTAYSWLRFLSVDLSPKTDHTLLSTRFDNLAAACPRMDGGPNGVC